MAPLQKRAFYGLIFGIAWIIVIIVVFILKGGAAAFDADRTFRLIMDAIWIGGLIVYLVLFYPILRKLNLVDERDKLIYDRSPRTQWLAVIFTLVAWVIGLTEAFRSQGVPSVYLYLMFFTILCVSAVAQSIGILVGYWRINRDG
ncbi:MAG: hypothetical protein C4555_02590 [Dehalococcoidia bacterium]|jgi:hypothetical protein|nr:MAG: hypothetical protein C4555_02590 [Dehalococcoidia bacterium]